jgi:YebC/PmpR family DNA-binding regulatory protein
MAGHSKWANIKHKKARQDAKRGKAWSKCSKAIMAAARNGGGDPDANLTLRYAIEEAKAVNMPKDTIEKAIAKGTGETTGENFEAIIYEGYGPNGVAVMLDILTNNRNRTAGEIRKIFERAGGNLGGSGCVSYIFTPKGQIFVPRAAADEETVMLAALDAGADDVTDDGESWQITCDPTAFTTVRAAVEQAGLPIESAALTQIPGNTVTCTGDEARKVLNLMEQLEDHDDVQKAYANFEIPDAEMAALE